MEDPGAEGKWQESRGGEGVGKTQEYGRRPREVRGPQDVRRKVRDSTWAAGTRRRPPEAVTRFGDGRTGGLTPRRSRQQRSLGWRAAGAQDDTEADVDVELRRRFVAATGAAAVLRVVEP